MNVSSGERQFPSSSPPGLFLCFYSPDSSRSMICVYWSNNHYHYVACPFPHGRKRSPSGLFVIAHRALYQVVRPSGIFMFGTPDHARHAAYAHARRQPGEFVDAAPSAPMRTPAQAHGAGAHASSFTIQWGDWGGAEVYIHHISRAQVKIIGFSSCCERSIHSIFA